MSLINKMLRDLDDRQASAAERAGLANQVRALPPERRFPWTRVLLVAAGAVVGAVGLWLLVDSPPTTVTPTSIPAAPTPPVVAPAVATDPVIAMPALVVPMPSGGADAPTEGVVIESLRLDSKLSHGGTPRPRPDATVEPVATAKTNADAGPAVIDKRAHEAVPGNPAEAEYRKAMVAFRQGRPSEALAGFQNALRADARHLAARQALLSLLMTDGRWPEAQAAATEGLTLDATQSGWAMILARLQLEQGQAAEAQETLARHAPHGEHSADYQAFHALLLQKLQRPKEAVERYRAAAALRPNEGRWWYGLGLALEADQRPQEAREAFRQASSAGNLPPELAAPAEQRLR